MITRIQGCHEEKILHRDIKPDNFLIGGKDQTKDKVYIIDFGLAKFYKDNNGNHIAYKDGKSLTGTARYASLNTHLGVEQSRRDDLESIGHVLLYFLKGSLPWQGLPGKNRDEKYLLIKKKKLEISLDVLCKGQPKEFKEFMEYCRKLKFDEEPDYKFCLTLFRNCMLKNNIDPNSTDYVWKRNQLEVQK
jgi:casein kinase 1